MSGDLATPAKAGVRPPIRVFWAPGCTSCLRTKEFLTRHGVDYLAINAAGDPGAKEAMAALGARSVPVVARGEEWIYSQKLEDVIAFLRMDVKLEGRLPAAELARRIPIILRAGQRYVRQIPDDVLDRRFRDSVRILRGIAHHVFRIVEAHIEADERRIELSNELIMDETENVRPGDDVAAYADRVIARFEAWWVAHPDKAQAREMDTYFGRVPAHEVLERTTWHAAQHVRQLMLVVQSEGIAIDRLIGAEVLGGLPMPERVWED